MQNSPPGRAWRVGAGRRRVGREVAGAMFMLIVVAMLGMIPAAVATGIGSDIQRPLATIIVGGLASTLLLTLLVLPSLYYVTAGGRYRASRLAELFGEKDHHDR